jgi:hypothetical protein
MNAKDGGSPRSGEGGESGGREGVGVGIKVV